jgi:hypothetical protein
MTTVNLIRASLATAIAPFALTGASSIVSVQAKKEQLAAVRSDAVDFLAGSDASEVLKASINEIKERSEDLRDLSDSQIAGLIITALE